MARIIHKGHGYVVTNKTVTTPKAVHRTADLKSVSVRFEIALSALLPAIGLGVGAFVFGKYLYPIEFALLVGGSVVVAILSANIGTLQVTSLTLANTPGMGRTWGYRPHLKTVEAAIEKAMADDGEGVEP